MYLLLGRGDTSTSPVGIGRSSRSRCRPTPPVRIAGELQVLLSRADRALGRLDGSIQTLPHPDLFVYMYVRKEAVLRTWLATKSTSSVSTAPG